MAEAKSELEGVGTDLENIEKEFLVEYENVIKEYTNLVTDEVIEILKKEESKNQKSLEECSSKKVEMRNAQNVFEIQIQNMMNE